MSSLTVLVVTSDAGTITLVRDALRSFGDDVRVVDDPVAAIEASDGCDAVFVDLGLRDGAGLALAHFLSARDENSFVIALSHGDAENESVAHALGVRAVVPRPLTGDSILVPLATVRELSVAITPLPKPRFSITPSTLIESDLLGSVLDATELRTLADALVWAAHAITQRPARVRIEDSKYQMIECSAGDPDDGAYDEIALSARDEALGTLFVRAEGTTLSAITQLAMSASAVGVLLRGAETAARTGIKDPETSAYTFAYFVDAAGREVERAHRHGRRFGLLTFQLDDYEEQRKHFGDEPAREARREFVDTVLDTAQDVDVLALVEEDELYLLAPEAGRLRTLALRRRIAEKQRRRSELARLEGRARFSVAIGAATFPRDGRELATLARAALARGRRVEAQFNSWREPGVGLEASLGALLRLRPGAADWAVRQGALSTETILATSQAVSREATRTTTANDGVIYLVGDRAHPLVSGAYDVLKRAPAGCAPAYWLRPSTEDGREPSSPGIRLSPVEIEVDGQRIGSFALLVVLAEGWAYACVASAHGEYKRMMHTSDLDLVEAIASELQSTFHLQRGAE